MRFSVVSANDILARAVSVAVSILLAWAAWGYWALVAGAIVLPLATSIGAWVLCRWVPGLPRRGVGTGPMVRFAMSTYGRFTANYFTWNLDNLLVGWRLGPVPLGFYKKAYDLFVLPTNQLSAPLTAVAVSVLSRLTRDPMQYRRYFLSALSTLAFVGMGLGADLTLIGKDLILLLLGPRWEESGRIFTFFGPGIGVMLLYFTHGWIHLSIGRADRWFRWGVVEFTVTGLLFLLGLPWGPVGIAVAWVLAAHGPRALVRRKAGRPYDRPGHRRCLEVRSCLCAGGLRIRRDHPRNPVFCRGVGFGWGRRPHRDDLLFVHSSVSRCSHLLAPRVRTPLSRRGASAGDDPMGQVFNVTGPGGRLPLGNS